MNWISRLFFSQNSCGKPGEHRSDTSKEIDSKSSAEAALFKASPGIIKTGEHYIDTVERVKQLKRDGNLEEAEALLREDIKATEREASYMGSSWGVAPWYYEQLAIIYRKRKDYRSEVEVLERYANQPHAPGTGPKRLAERLEKARTLLAKNEEN